ncbi:hypothetical protein CPT_Merlin114 [Citrobacter phage Merlin]|uniref:Uncharacterized protein n=1 Tax=Citrobacter phage Merlin TaxID=1675602 RepID=A0A0K1LNM6_9CAUD|nr:hypothetical protein CPT_Merlin114 [Citrobacter phage Merlin]AKU43760.1 hypothetical protein CPT_Merlin114 [Citrobacter phage Merlin]
MSRTIRRKGWHVTTSSKWHNQKNNEFAYIKRYTEYVKTSKDKANQAKYVERYIAENKKEPVRLEKLMKERHRDSFWKTLRWSRYASPIPRVFHKMEIKNSLRNDTDYNWDEKAARKCEKGIAQMNWD